MKCILISDIHLGVSRNDDIWLNQSIELFQNIIDECVRRDVYSLCILGDFFHDRKNLYIKTMDTAIKIADMLQKSKIHVVYLKGNHDVFYKTDNNVSSLHIFNEYPNIEIIDESVVIDNISFTSWNGELLDAKYLFGHLEINSFPVTNTMIFKDSHYNPPDFKKYKRVITGHFHIPSSKGNITYLGSPCHLNFNDVGTERGYYYFDSENDILDFIKFNGIRFECVSTEDGVCENKIKGNVIKLIFEKDYGSVENNKRIEHIQSFNPLRVSVDFSKLSNEITSVKMDENQIQNIKSNKEILFDFIEIGNHPDHIDIGKMKKIVDMLIEE
jgi:DNA repair exonuclease SbcCD nuclease subunit